MIPHAFLGTANGLVLLDEGQLDDDETIDFRAQTSPVAPAGANLDCTFDRVFLTVTHAANGRVRLTPVVDGDDISEAAFSIALRRPASGYATATVQRVLRKRSVVPGRPTIAHVPRGTWFAVRIENDGVLKGDLVIDQLALEWKPFRSTDRTPAAR